MRANLLRWQYEGYPRYHAARANLLIHIVAVPAFVGCAGWLVASAVRGRPTHAVAAAVGMAIAFAVQGIGHKRETTPSIPFDGPGDAVSRIFVEQFVSFPRFVLSGGFASALRSARSRVASPGA